MLHAKKVFDIAYFTEFSGMRFGTLFKFESVLRERI